MQLAIDLSIFNFWLIYYKKILISSDGLFCRLDYIRDNKPENLTIDDTSVFQKILLLFVNIVNA